LSSHDAFLRAVIVTTPLKTPVSMALAKLGIPHRQFTHAGSVLSLEQAAAERGQRPAQVVRSILFRLSADRFAMVLVAGPDSVAWKALRKAVGQSRLTMATEDEVLRVTGYVIGTVSPLGLPQPVAVYVDEGVLAEAEISIGSGARGTTVILSSADLVRALPDAVVGKFRASNA
jgi:Cys-tRNA(Pro) deacylase